MGAGLVAPNFNIKYIMWSFKKKKFNFTEYLLEQRWEVKKNNFFEKNKKTIRLIINRDRKLMIVLNLNPKIKHKHIVTCKIPSSVIEADVLFNLTMLKK